MTSDTSKSGEKEMRSHCIISGTGRAGTTFLVQLLTELGLDTGFTKETIEPDPISKAGLEHNILSESAPYIIKSPWLCDIIDEVVKVRTIDHAIIPVRDLDAATASRVRVTKSHGLKGRIFTVKGGLWHKFSPRKQKNTLAVQFANLVYSLVSNDIPITFLDFPRFLREAECLYRDLDFLLAGITFDEFHDAFNKTVNLEWVHEFKQ